MHSVEPSAPTSGTSARADRKSILMVEDDVLLRMPVAEYLRDHGFRVIEAESAAEAKSILMAGAQVDVLFSDVRMPGEDSGIDLAMWVKDLFSDVKIILTSGFARFDKRADELSALSGVVQKPYDPQDIVLRVHAA